MFDDFITGADKYNISMKDTRIETERLILRPFRKGDEKEMFQNWASDEKVTEYLTWKPHPNVLFTKKIVDMWVNDNPKETVHRFAIEYKPIHQIIGSIDVVQYKNEEPEIGYALGYDFWNLGIMTETLKAFIVYLFKETDCQKIYARHYIENKASRRVMQKAGMRYIGEEPSKISDRILSCYVIERP